MRTDIKSNKIAVKSCAQVRFEFQIKGRKKYKERSKELKKEERQPDRKVLNKAFIHFDQNILQPFLTGTRARTYALRLKAISLISYTTDAYCFSAAFSVSVIFWSETWRACLLL